MIPAKRIIPILRAFGFLNGASHIIAGGFNHGLTHHFRIITAIRIGIKGGHDFRIRG